MSVNNSIFKGDYFKLKYQMLQIDIDVLFVIWSTTIGKIVSGRSLDPRFFFLFLFVFPFIASLFILSFGKFVSAAQWGGTPWTPFFPPSFFLFSPYGVFRKEAPKESQSGVTPTTT